MSKTPSLRLALESLWNLIWCFFILLRTCAHHALVNRVLLLITAYIYWFVPKYMEFMEMNPRYAAVTYWCEVNARGWKCGSVERIMR